MRSIAVFIAVMGAISSGGCKKKTTETKPAPVGAPSDATGAAPPSGAAGKEQAEDDERKQRERERKQELLAYATMEERYLSDAKGQWATSARASSSFGSAGKEPPASHSSNTPWQATGAPNGESWSNDHQDMGIDWLELVYERPVVATEVRAVLTGEIGAVSKVELTDEAGVTHEVWSGTDDTTPDRRGPRTWLVRTFPPTASKIVKVKLSFANAVATGYKEVDAVQLIGD